MDNDKIRQYEPGGAIFREGERGDAMYILVEGAVELTMKVERGETVLKTVDRPGDFFGEMALIDERPRSASASALGAAKVLEVDGKAFEAMILSNGKFALKIIKALSERIRRSNDTVSDLIETMPRERIARAMVDFALQRGERIHDGAIKVNAAAMKDWVNGHIGAAGDEIDAAVFRFLKNETIAWAPTSAKTKEYFVLPEGFIKENDRRANG